VYLIFPRSDPAKEFEKFTATVERIDTDIRITSAGQVAPNRKVNVGPKEAGLLTALYVEQGQAVRKGRFWLAWILVGLFMKSLRPKLL